MSEQIKQLRREHDDLIRAGRFLEAKHFCVQILIPAEKEA